MVERITSGNVKCKVYTSENNKKIKIKKNIFFCNFTLYTLHFRREPRWTQQIHCQIHCQIQTLHFTLSKSKC